MVLFAGTASWAFLEAIELDRLGVAVLASTIVGWWVLS